MSIFNKKKKVENIESIPKEENKQLLMLWKEEECIYDILLKNKDLSRIVIEESFKQNSISDLEKFSFEELINSIINDSIQYSDDSLIEVYNSFGFLYFEKIKRELFYELERRKDKLNIKNLVSRAEWLVKNGTRINLVKYAMFVLGKYSEDINSIIILGKNEYFTLNAIEVLKRKDNSKFGMKEIFKNAKASIKNKILNDLKLDSDEDAIWLIEEGINNTVVDCEFSAKCIQEGKVVTNLLLDSVSDKYINGVTILIYNIIKGQDRSLYNIEDGGIMFNHYVKHIMLRVINNSSLKAKSLCNIYYIKEFILDEKNKEYLINNGLCYDDFNLVTSFADRIIRFPGWKKILVLQLNERDHDSFDHIMEATDILKCNIWLQVYNLCIEVNGINSNLIKYLIIYDIYNSQDKILEVILEKSDVVNIKFPKIEKGTVVCEECIAIESFLRKYNKETKKYLDLIELTCSSTLPSLLILSTELLKKWNRPLKDFVSLERLDSMLEDEKISNLTKKKLMDIYDNILINL